MALPLPSVVPNVGPGGRIFDVMNTIGQSANALTQGQLQNKYYPQTQQADIASKLTYANLMGPQYLAKLFGNEGILANIPENQRNNALQQLVRSGMGGNQQPQMTNPNNGPILGNVGNNNFLQNQPNLSQQDINALRNQQQGQTYQIQGNQPSQQPQQLGQQPNQDIPQKQPTYSENVGSYKGIVEEGKEAGKIRAKDIESLNNIVFNSTNKQSTFDDLSRIVSSPEFEQIRQLPVAGRHELSYYSKFGTPEQQKMVGNYFALTGNIVRDTAQDFKGSFRKGEQQLVTGMKPSSSDTVDVARGKLESISTLNRMLTERARLTSRLMSENHINKLQAQEIADKQINGEEIRNQVHDKLYPVVTIKNSKTGETMTLPIEEARKKYGVKPNV